MLGMELGKDVCDVGLGAKWQVLEAGVGDKVTQKLPSSIVATEACCGAQHLGEQLAPRGHEVLLSAALRQRTKAVAIAEAGTGPTKRFVEVRVHRSR